MISALKGLSALLSKQKLAWKGLTLAILLAVVGSAGFASAAPDSFSNVPSGSGDAPEVRYGVDPQTGRHYVEVTKSVVDENEYGENYSNVDIPDASGGEPGGWVSSEISISGAPSGTEVTSIEVYFRCVHTYSGDLRVDLNADPQGDLGNVRLWDREGGSADNPERTVDGITEYSGLSVNRTWYLYAQDYAEEDEGYIDEWTIRVYYESASAPPAPELVSPGSGSSPGPELSDVEQTFQWESVSGAEHYGLYVRDLTEDDLVVNDDNVNSTSQTVTLTEGHDYEWETRAYGDGEWSDFSENYYFQIETSEPEVPTSEVPQASTFRMPIGKVGGTTDLGNFLSLLTIDNWDSTGYPKRQFNDNDDDSPDTNEWYVATAHNEDQSISCPGCQFTGETVIYDEGQHHPGEDWNLTSGGDSDKGKPVLSIANGIVLHDGCVDNYGRAIILVHKTKEGKFVTSLYAHLEDNPPYYSVGDEISKGDTIGHIGGTSSSECSSGFAPHLHFEIRCQSMLKSDVLENGFVELKYNPGMWPPPPGYDSTQQEFIADNYKPPSKFIDTYSDVPSTFFMLRNGLNLISFPVDPPGTMSEVLTSGQNVGSTSPTTSTTDLFEYVFWLGGDGTVDYGHITEVTPEAKRGYFVFLEGDGPMGVDYSGTSVDPALSLHRTMNMSGVARQNAFEGNSDLFPSAFYIEGGQVKTMDPFNEKLDPSTAYFLAAGQQTTLTPEGTSSAAKKTHSSAAKKQRAGRTEVNRIVRQVETRIQQLRGSADSTVTQAEGITSKRSEECEADPSDDFRVCLTVAQELLNGDLSTLDLAAATNPDATGGWEDGGDNLQSFTAPGVPHAYFDEGYGLQQSVRPTGQDLTEWPLLVESASTSPGQGENTNPVQLSWEVPQIPGQKQVQLLDSEGNVLVADMTEQTELSRSVDNPGEQWNFKIRLSQEGGGNQAPTVLTSVPNQTLEVPDPPLQFSGLNATVFQDPNGDELSFSATSSNPSVVEPTDGDSPGVALQASSSGTAEVTITASDGATETTTSFTVTVDEQSPEEDTPHVHASAVVTTDGESHMFDFGDTGVKLMPLGIDGSGDIRIEYFDTQPDGTDGIGESTVGQYRVVITPAEGLSLGSNSEVRFPVNDFGGIENPSEVVVYRRPTAGSGAFSEVPTFVDDGGTPDDTSDDEIIATTGSFGEFALASDTNPLPVEVASFTASLDGKTALLRWRTASETNNAGFEVQHQAPDQSSFIELAFVESKAEGGTTDETKQYRFASHRLAPGTHKFRLRQINANGSGTLSDTATVDVEAKHVLTLEPAGPNPVREATQFAFTVKQDGRAEVELYNVLGQEIRQLYVGKAIAGERYRINVSTKGLSSGTYFLRLQAQSGTKTQMLTVVK